MRIDISSEIKISDLIAKDKTGDRVDKVMEAGMFIVEGAYVDQVPVNKNDPGFLSGIQVKRKKFLDYVVESTAKRGDVEYPALLYSGTGKMRGRSDFGYTSGRVRAGDVAYGIGGIRPNKAALRAKKNSMDEYILFIKNKLDIS